MEIFCDSVAANQDLFDEVVALGQTGGPFDTDLSTPPATREEMAAAVPTFTNLYNAATVLLASAPEDVKPYVENLQGAADNAVLNLPQGDPMFDAADSLSAISTIRDWTTANC